MAQAATVDWKAIVADPRFQALHRKKTGFLWGLMVFSVVYYFLLPHRRGLFPAICSRSRCGGRSTSGILFALSEFVVAWAIAFVYARRPTPSSTPMAAELIRDAEKIGSTQMRHDETALPGAPARSPACSRCSPPRRLRRKGAVDRQVASGSPSLVFGAIIAHHDVRHVPGGRSASRAPPTSTPPAAASPACRTAGRSPATTCRRPRSSASPA